MAMMEEEVVRIRRHGALWRAWQKAPTNSDREKELAIYCRTLRDRILGAAETISHMHPQSNSGAMYLAMIGYADVGHAHEFADTELKNRRLRRGLPCLSTALDYLGRRPGNITVSTIEQWFVPYNETERTRSIWGEDEGRKLLVAERAGAS
jgi:hypothetical protein